MANAGARILAADTTRWYTKAVQNTVQSIPTGSFTALQFNGTDEVDNLGIHDPVTNNSRFVIGLALGWWYVQAKFACSATAAAQQRRSRLILNGGTGINGGYSGTPVYSATAMTGGFWTIESSSVVQATASTDYVEVQGFQDSGGALNTVVSGDLRCQFIALYQGP